jgi:hypothetical protein
LAVLGEPNKTIPPAITLATNKLNAVRFMTDPSNRCYQEFWSFLASASLVFEATEANRKRDAFEENLRNLVTVRTTRSPTALAKQGWI